MKKTLCTLITILGIIALMVNCSSPANAQDRGGWEGKKHPRKGPAMRDHKGGMKHNKGEFRSQDKGRMKAFMLKKFDRNGDGKLGPKERAMAQKFLKTHPDMAKRLKGHQGPGKAKPMKRGKGFRGQNKGQQHKSQRQEGWR